MNKPEEIIARYYAAFNARDFDAYARLFGADAEIVAPGVSARGLDSMRGFDRGWTEAFPEAQLECLRMDVADGQVAAAIWFHGGPQRGAAHTPAGVIPATGKTLDCPAFVMFKIEGERIVRQQLMFEPSWVAIKLGVAH